jgi:hypothetical protein
VDLDKGAQGQESKGSSNESVVGRGCRKGTFVEAARRKDLLRLEDLPPTVLFGDLPLSSADRRSESWDAVGGEAVGAVGDASVVVGVGRIASQMAGGRTGTIR